MKTLLATLAQAVLGAVVDGVLRFLRQRRRDRALEESGAADQAERQREAADEAEDRMDRVPDERGRAGTVDRLRGGDF